MAFYWRMGWPHWPTAKMVGGLEQIGDKEFSDGGLPLICRATAISQ